MKDPVVAPDPRPGPAARVGLVLALVFLVAMVGLAIAGAVRTFSPVPHWDVWDAGLGFFLRLEGGESGLWWAQHNEHRIVLARLLMWLDMSLFDGRGWFLIVVNHLLAGTIAFVFWRQVRARAGTARPERVELVLGAFVAGWVLSWAQRDNLMWTFQSQFFLAQLLPLTALLALARAVQRPEERFTFVAACALGLLAIGSMANGVLAFPLLIVLALWTRASWGRVAILVALTALAWWLYFHDYRSDPEQASWSFVLQRRWKALVAYVLMYLGNPLNAMFGGGRIGRVAAVVGGALWFGLVALAGRRCLRRERDVALPVALLLFAVYVAGSGMAAGGGRLQLGANQSLTGRYATPGLMAWAVVFVLYAPIGVRRDLAAIPRYAYWSALALLGGAALAFQTHALDDESQVDFERRVAALALELGVHDAARIGKVYPDTGAVLEIAAGATARDLSVFGLEPLVGLHERIGTPVGAAGEAIEGRLERDPPIADETRFARVRGQVQRPGGAVPPAVWLVDPAGTIVGCALTGPARDDGAGRDGLQGYLLADRPIDGVRMVPAGE